jgi:ubiquinone/menaquinone biosynthesis C-methylase UbiE
LSYKAESRKGWGSVAAGWKRFAPAQREAWMPVSAWMLDAARLHPGARVLELATGTGELGLMAHELIQPGGELILSDFAPEMLSVAQEQAAEQGAEDIRFKQIDIESIDVEAASLDAVLCRWGLMFLTDPEAGVREVRRVLRPGGRFATAAWTTPEENQWSSAAARILVERGHMEQASGPGQFALARDGLLRELLENAGFVEEIEVVALDLELVETFEDCWARTVGMSRVGATIAGLPRDEQDAIREELRTRLAPYERDGVLHIPGRTWVAAATA